MCLTVFFFTYAAFEVPSNLLLKKLRPSRWLPTIMVAWGIVMTLMGLVRSYSGLLAARIFLGVTEAGLFPGVAYYLTMWYTREEIQLRQALFFSAASIAGAFSGLLAFAIAKMDGLSGLEGWRYIFILEGIATVVVAVGSFFALHDFPETASFLTDEEREFVVFRLKYQGQLGERSDDEESDTSGQNLVAEADGFRWKYVRQAFLDWQIWVNIFVYWGVSVSVLICVGRSELITGWTGCVSALWDQPLSPQHHPGPRVHVQLGAVVDNSRIHNGRHSGGRGGIFLGPGRQEESLYHRVPPGHGGGL